MIKRPLDARFSSAVLEGRKTTTIRDNAWPVGVPIQLYNWSGAPYRSPQTDVAVVIVQGFWSIQITSLQSREMIYECGKESAPALWESEGFVSQEEMDEWFRPLVKPGKTITKTLMRFRLANENSAAPPPQTCPTCGERCQPDDLKCDECGHDLPTCDAFLKR